MHFFFFKWKSYLKFLLENNCNHTLPPGYVTAKDRTENKKALLLMHFISVLEMYEKMLEESYKI